MPRHRTAAVWGRALALIVGGCLVHLCAALEPDASDSSSASTDSSTPGPDPVWPRRTKTRTLVPHTPGPTPAPPPFECPTDCHCPSAPRLPKPLDLEVFLRIARDAEAVAPQYPYPGPIKAGCGTAETAAVEKGIAITSAAWFTAAIAESDGTHGADTVALRRASEWLIAQSSNGLDGVPLTASGAGWRYGARQAEFEYFQGGYFFPLASINRTVDVGGQPTTVERGPPSLSATLQVALGVLQAELIIQNPITNNADSVAATLLFRATTTMSAMFNGVGYSETPTPTAAQFRPPGVRGVRAGQLSVVSGVAVATVSQALGYVMTSVAHTTIHLGPGQVLIDQIHTNTSRFFTARLPSYGGRSLCDWAWAHRYFPLGLTDAGAIDATFDAVTNIQVVGSFGAKLGAKCHSGAAVGAFLQAVINETLSRVGVGPRCMVEGSWACDGVALTPGAQHDTAATALLRMAVATILSEGNSLPLGLRADLTVLSDAIDAGVVLGMSYCTKAPFTGTGFFSPGRPSAPCGGPAPAVEPTALVLLASRGRSVFLAPPRSPLTPRPSTPSPPGATPPTSGSLTAQQRLFVILGVVGGAALIGGLLGAGCFVRRSVRIAHEEAHRFDAPDHNVGFF